MRKVARNLSLLLLGVGLLLGGVAVTPASAAKVTFEITDEPGSWFRNTAGGGSLAITTPGSEVVFTGKSNTVHTRTSLIFPTGAINMPFDTEPRKGSDSVVLHTPGLYVFTCKIHPYMFGAVIVDDPSTADALELGKQISLVHFPAGVGVPTKSDLALRLLRTFFIATNPANWKDYTKGKWTVSYPAVPVRVGALDSQGNINDEVVPNLAAALNLYGNDIDLTNELFNPASAVGEIWVDTQFEKTSGKTKPGTATAISGQTWKPTRKVALPQINMNNPHNMWTDKNQNVIYQTQWFDSKLTVFNRTTGRLVNNITVGESPAHVMTQIGSDKLHVTLNGATDTKSVVELSANAGGILRKIDIGEGNPHAHWMSHDGNLMLTPNPFDNNSTQFNFDRNAIYAKRPTGALPIATGMTPNSQHAYVANLLDSTITVINTDAQLPAGEIKLLEKYDPIGGCPGFALYRAIPGLDCSVVGALPIQTPVAPDGKSMVTANTLTGTITVVDIASNTVVKTLPCDPGCHGVQYGAKKDGGYYAYVSSKFSNALIVVGFNETGDAASAHIAGRILLTDAGSTTAKDATITGNAGMGGQGILTIPVVYNGWVQQLPQAWKDQLTSAQRNPIP
ncbi:MAG: copper oxidase [Nitrospira sp.]|nr:copper oxidase [Nitrospira sp.]